MWIYAHNNSTIILMITYKTKTLNIFLKVIYLPLLELNLNNIIYM